VGLSTRNKLEDIGNSAQNTASISSTQISKPANIQVQGSVSPVVAKTQQHVDISESGVIPQNQAFRAFSPNDLFIYGLSHKKIRPGDMLALTGYGFDSDTIVHIGPTVSVQVSATSTDEMEFRVPTNLFYSTYPIWVTNKKGSSLKDRSILVSNVTDSPPVIQSVSPSEAVQGGAITIVTDKLDRTGNSIYSSLGIIRGVTSVDGRTAIVNVNDFPKAVTFFQNQELSKIPVTFSIESSQGRSIDYGYFNLNK
jgi:hypothetical protein